MANYLNNKELDAMGKPKYTRGIRNNNPGNLRRLGNQLWSGEIPYAESQDTAFSQFKEMKYGVRALQRQIVTNLRRGLNTPEKFINSYAPPHENNTLAYINSVAKALAIATTSIIEPSEETVIALAKIIVKVENGASSKYVADSDYTAAMALNANLKLKKKATPPKL